MATLSKMLLPVILMTGLLAGCVYEGPGYDPRYGYGYSRPYQPYGYAPTYSFGFSYYGGGGGYSHHHWNDRD